jgi:hypothetical protein
MATLFVCVPDGLLPGETFTVSCETREFDVVCPPGCGAGHELEICLPPSEPAASVVDVSVPPGVAPGQEFLVTLDDGFDFYVVVPDGVGPGDCLSVEVPPPPPLPDSEEERTPPETPPRSRRVSRDDVTVHSRYGSRRTSRELDAMVCSHGSHHGSRRVSRELPLPELPQPDWSAAMSPSGQRAAKLRSAVLAARLPSPGTLSRSPTASKLPTLAVWPQPPVGRFFHGQVVEVERSSGAWSNASIEEHDEGGDTYTVKLPDGRLKYFVEANEVRAVRCGAFAAGRRVLLSMAGAGAKGTPAHVEGYDDESATYSVRLLDGSLRPYVTDDELQEVR